MAEQITTTQLLDFLVKADKVSSHITVKKRHGEYEIGVCCPWDDDNDFYTQNTFISEEGHSTWETSDYDFFTMNFVLDELVKKEEIREQCRQKRQKFRQKRQELLSTLEDN